MNNRGSDKVISIYWFAILFIVAGGIIYMTALFYGSPYDVRDIEQRFLENRVADCLAQGGYLNEDIFSRDFEDKFMEFCHLNFNTEDVYDWSENKQYYLEVKIFNFNRGDENPLGENVFSVRKGNLNIKTAREVSNKELGKSFYTLGNARDSYLIKIIALVDKSEKNVI